MKRLGVALFFILTVISVPGFGSKMWVIDPTGTPRLLHYYKKAGYALIEGDILLTNAPIEKSFLGSVVDLKSMRWINGIIPFTIDANLSEKRVQFLKAAMKLWEEKTPVRFIEITPEELSNYPDYIYIQSVSGLSCSTQVGRTGGKQLLNLAERCHTMAMAHELGHVIGLWHEQSRGDREQYVRIVWENIQIRHYYNFNQHITDGIDHGPYNYDSIMHYSAYAFSKNGSPTIIPLDPNVHIGQRTHLSDGDIFAVNAMYPPGNYEEPSVRND